MGENKRRPIFPIILMVVGLVILVGAIAGVFLLTGSDDQSVADNPDPGVPYPQIQRVDLSTTKEAFDNGTAIFVDVRGEAYFQQGHIPGALSIPLNELEARLDALGQDEWIILYCT